MTDAGVRIENFVLGKGAMAAAARTCFQIRCASVLELEITLPGWTQSLSIAASGVRLDLEERLLPLVCHELPIVRELKFTGHIRVLVTCLWVNSKDLHDVTSRRAKTFPNPQSGRGVG